MLYFYPKDNTPGCTIEGKDFSKYLEEFAKVNAQVIGVSSDSIESHCSFIDKQGLKVMLLSDKKKTFLKKIGVLGKKSMFGKAFDEIIRTTLLIDEKEIIKEIWENVKPSGHAEAVLEKIRIARKNPGK